MPTPSSSASISIRAITEALPAWKPTVLLRAACLNGRGESKLQRLCPAPWPHTRSGEHRAGDHRARCVGPQSGFDRPRCETRALCRHSKYHHSRHSHRGRIHERNAGRTTIATPEYRQRIAECILDGVNRYKQAVTNQIHTRNLPPSSLPRIPPAFPAWKKSLPSWAPRSKLIPRLPGPRRLSNLPSKKTESLPTSHACRKNSINNSDFKSDRLLWTRSVSSVKIRKCQRLWRKTMW